MNRRHFLAATLPAALALRALPARAQTGLDGHGAIRLEVGAPPGGGTDTVARAMAMGMAPAIKRNIVVENRPGAGGNIAASTVAQAAGDASILLLAYTSHSINASIQDNLPFDPLKSFTPVSLVATCPLILVCNPALPVSNTAELIDYARRNPGKLSMAGAGLGSASQMSGEMLKAQAKLDIISVPYKGAAPAIQDILGGQVQMMLSDVAAVRPFIQSGKLKALGVSVPEPIAAFPQLAPIDKVLPGFDYRIWYGLLGPAGLDPAQAATLEQAAQAAVKTDAVSKHLVMEGLDPVGSTSVAFTDFIRKELARWKTVAQVTGVHLS
ncbi:MAG TPA: tripartite tricarboxylate transporter substrate-binding protein [Bordetella sp.]